MRRLQGDLEVSERYQMIRESAIPTPIEIPPEDIRPVSPPINWERYTQGRWDTSASPLDSIPEGTDMPVSRTSQEFYNRRLLDFIPRLQSHKQEGDIGVEIECEGQNLFSSPLRYWACHQDGSLRQSPEGHPPLEYVLRQPLSRKEVSEALEYLTLKLRGAKSRVLDSHRTSVHIHFNCQKWTLKEIFTFVCLYLLFENALVEFSGPDRVGNLFCQRAKDSQFWIYSIVRAFQTGAFRDVFSDNFRYTSCNTASLSKFGSLEFRSMRGTVDQETIENWIDLLDRIRQRSRTFKDPFDLYQKYYDSTPMDFFEMIFKDTPKLKELLSGTSNLSSGIEQGSIFVRDIAYSLENWREAIAESKIKKKKEIVREEVPREEPPPEAGQAERILRENRAAIAGRRLDNNTNYTIINIAPTGNTRNGISFRHEPDTGVFYDA